MSKKVSKEEKKNRKKVKPGRLAKRERWWESHLSPLGLSGR